MPGVYRSPHSTMIHVPPLPVLIRSVRRRSNETKRPSAHDTSNRSCNSKQCGPPIWSEKSRRFIRGAGRRSWYLGRRAIFCAYGFDCTSLADRVSETRARSTEWVGGEREWALHNLIGVGSVAQVRLPGTRQRTPKRLPDPEKCRSHCAQPHNLSTRFTTPSAGNRPNASPAPNHRPIHNTDGRSIATNELH